MGTLLGHLTQFGSFSTQGELLCTQGLKYLLQYGETQSAFADSLAEWAGVKITENLTWYAEAHHDADSGRSDLEARTSDGTPRIEIEAKLSAPLGDGQLRCYAKRLHGRSTECILLVLVPSRRTGDTTNVVTAAFGVSGSGPWRWADCPDVAVAVVSWDDVLTALGRVDSQPFQSELGQFQAMYKVLSGYAFPKLAGVEDLLSWRERERYFVTLADQVTKRLTIHHAVYPMGTDTIEQPPPEGLEPRGYRRRYICQRVGDKSACFSIGVRDPFMGTDTPIWLRFNSTTGSFPVIRDRLDASVYKSRLVYGRDGHIWIPIVPPFDTEDEALVNALVEDVQALLRVALPSTALHSSPEPC